jgi:deoxyhypusine synthase
MNPREVAKLKKTKNFKNRILVNDVIDYRIRSNSATSILADMAKSGGFESKNLSTGVEILGKMKRDARCTKFLSFVGSIISTGARGIIRDLIKRKMFDCVITTCGALDHDIARCNAKYYSGEWMIKHCSKRTCIDWAMYSYHKTVMVLK